MVSGRATGSASRVGSESPSTGSTAEVSHGTRPARGAKRAGLGYGPPIARLEAHGRRALGFVDSEAGSWIAIWALVWLSIALALWLTRGTTMFSDDLWFYAADRGFDLRVLLSQHNGHLVFVPRLIWAIALKLFGADYAVLRGVEAIGVGLVGVLVFAAARRRVRPGLALALAVPTLFLGSTWDISLAVVGISPIYSIVFGLAAMLVVTSRRRYADPVACLLLALSLASFSFGIAFAAGIACAVLLRRDRWRRVWIPALPLALYVAWRVGNPGLSGPLFRSPKAHLSNVLLVPNYLADAAAAAASSLAGLAYTFTRRPYGIPPVVLDSTWGPALAVVAAGAIVVGLRHRANRSSAWPWVATLLVYWTSLAVAFLPRARLPGSTRYAYLGAVLILVLAAEAARRQRLPRRALALAIAIAALALGSNIKTLAEAGNSLRDYSARERADMAAIEIARRYVQPRFLPSVGVFSFRLVSAPMRAGTYLAAVDRNGSFAYDLPELRSSPEAVREEADQVLAEALGLHLAPAGRSAEHRALRCRRLGPSPAATGFPLPRGGAILRSTAGGAVTVHRFAAASTVSLGALPARQPTLLRVPIDLAPDPWVAAVTEARPLTVCKATRGT
jgi:hypothetical protein